MKNSFHNFLGKDLRHYNIFSIVDLESHQLDDCLRLISDIQLLETDSDYFLSPEDNFPQRNKLSFACLHNEEVVGVFVSYMRVSDQKIPLDSIYIHRVSVKKEHRRNGVGELSLRWLINYFYSNIQWLFNITIQSTMYPENTAACRLYEKIGFNKFGIINYSNKLDQLYLLQNYRLEEKKYQDVDIFTNPRISSRLGKKVNDFTFYFSTTSELKKKQFEWLFSLYNLKIKFYTFSMDLVEPQIENTSPDEIRNLVFHPIKTMSRFIKKFPFFVEDTMLFIERFNKDFTNNPELPGMDTKRWWKQFENDGIIELLGDTSSRKALYVSQIGCFLEKGKYVYGKGELHGRISHIVNKPTSSIDNFPRTNPYFFHQIFIPEDHNHELSMLDDYNFTMVDYRRKALENMLLNLNEENFATGPQGDLFFNEQ